ncbi:hypothetical protein BJV78DRAFT_1158244 [Lactifluus subvellereus]|nr:hypothetical protein BJV78DRAFT_1158244 [Lactifluus subvellereus]
MRAAFLALLLPSVALGAITITRPSSTEYWVQDINNEIQWTYNQGDPTPVDIIVTNQANQTLNGPFSIARFVPVSQETFTVTGVTLRVATGYQVAFVNPANTNQVYATSSTFEVKAAGTTPAPTIVPTTSASASGTPTGSSASSSPSASSTKKSNAALGLAMDIPALLYTCSILALGTFFL